MVDRPSTGDPAVDAVIREKMPEACEIVSLILQDRHPELYANADSTKKAEQTCAIIVSQIWHPFSEILVAMMTLAAEDHSG